MRNRLLGGLSLLLLALAGGCWDHLPIERTAFVSLIGVDIDPEGTHRDVITYTIVRPTALGVNPGGGGPPDGGTPFYLVSSTEPGFQSTFSTHAQNVPRTVRFTHLRAIVLSEERARISVGNVLDWTVRNPNVRTTVQMAVSTGHAQVFLDTHPALEPLPGNTLADIIEMAALSGVTIRAPVYEFMRKVLSPRQDPVAPLVERIQPLRTSVPAGFQQQPIAGTSAQIANEVNVIGMAVFKGDVMVGTLTGSEARGATWIFGKSRASYTIPNSDRPDQAVGMITLASNSKIRPTVTDEGLRIAIDIEVLGEILETGNSSPGSAQRQAPEIERAFEEVIKTEVELAMRKLQDDLGADIYGVADIIYQSTPRTWKAIEPVWEELYRAAELEVTVKVRTVNSGLAK